MPLSAVTSRKCPWPSIVEKMIAIKRSDVNIGQAVVVVVGDRNADSVHFDIEAAALRHIGERAVVIIAIESRRYFWRPRRNKSLPLMSRMSRPSITIQVDECATRAHSFREVLLTGGARMMREVDACLGGYIHKADTSLASRHAESGDAGSQA